MTLNTLEKAEQFQNFSIKKCNAHYKAAENNKRRNLQLGIPVTVLTATVATSVFGTLSQNEKIVWLIFLTGVLAVLASVLSALQTFLKFPETAREHHSAAVAYEGIRRKLDIFLLKYANDTDGSGGISELNNISLELDHIAKTAPTLPDAVYDSVKWRPASQRSFPTLNESTDRQSPKNNSPSRN